MRHAFVVPAHGDSPFLPECLASLKAQSRRDSLLVITTSTPSPYLDQVAGRHGVPLVVNPRAGNIGSDWNFALCVTNASHVTLAHQDDLYRSDYLATMLNAMIQVPEALIGFSDYDERTAAGPRRAHLNIAIKQFLCRRAFGAATHVASPARRRRLLAWGNPICCPSVVVNRAAMPDFRFIDAMRSNLDWEAWQRCAERPGSFVYVREPLVTRRIHAHSETSAVIADQRRRDEDREMFERFWPAPFVKLLMAVYRLSYLANRT